ncbi:MAG: tetratricopeptide repeat protein, partial [Burkholderiaceae bacterium]
MRFANLFLNTSLMIGLVSAMTGCTTIDISQKSVQQDNASTEKTPAAETPATPPAAATVSVQQPAVPIVPPEPPVNPVAQRMFDEANRALKAGRINDAEHDYRSIIESNPELGGPHANLGVIYRNANKFTEALVEFNQAVRLSPKQPVYLNQLGVTYRQMGQFDKARDAYEQAIALDANYAPAILNLGIVCDMYLGESQRALELFVRYLALTPNGDATVS